MDFVHTPESSMDNKTVCMMRDAMSYREPIEGTYRFKEMLFNGRVCGVKCHDCLRYVAFGPDYNRDLLNSHTCEEHVQRVNEFWAHESERRSRRPSTFRAETFEERSNLHKIIEQEPHRVTYQAIVGHASSIFVEYDRVMVDGVCTIFVRCKTCFKLITFKTSSYLTNLKQHKCVMSAGGD